MNGDRVVNFLPFTPEVVKGKDLDYTFNNLAIPVPLSDVHLESLSIPHNGIFEIPSEAFERKESMIKRRKKRKLEEATPEEIKAHIFFQKLNMFKFLACSFAYGHMKLKAK